MIEYLEPEAARNLPGLRLVLTTGVPGPWGEAAKSIFHVKGIEYQPVRQDGGRANRALVGWTGQANAPQAILDDEAPRSGWADILFLAERLAPAPKLIPTDPRDRALCFGLAHEICGEQGLGWTRRHQLVQPMMSAPDIETNPALEVARNLSSRYGYSSGAASAADERVAEILGMFSGQLAAQKRAGSEYLVGSSLSAVDIYWATFTALLQPLPHEQCPMSDMMRGAYGSLSPKSEAALDRSLIEHRDRIYERYLTLPLEF